MAKYRTREIDWRNSVSCLHMARFHLRQMGHRVETLARIRSMTAALRVMKQRGWSNVADWLDAQVGLMRIAPARMLLGDLAALPGEGGVGAVTVCAGPQKVMGWREDAVGMVVIDVPFDQIEGSWRV